MNEGMKGVALVGVLAVALLAGCASMQNTLTQDLAYERWDMCKARFPDAQLNRVEPDGRLWFTYTSPSAASGVQACLREAAIEQGKRRAASVGPVGVAPAPTAVPEVVTTGALRIPVWQVGEEWAFRYDTPQEAGTFAWSVDRRENIAGVDHYVVKAGTREIFFRVSDGAVMEERISGDVVERYVPAWEMISWPLSVGKTWKTKHTIEYPVTRQTRDRALACSAETEETVTVPAGTFRAIRITCNNERTGALAYRIWYSPQIKQMVREETRLSVGGTRTRELIAFKLK